VVERSNSELRWWRYGFLKIKWGNICEKWAWELFQQMGIMEMG